MEKTNVKYNAYIKILEEELRPAMGCTEPIALAYAAAVARKVLGELPDKVVIGASGSIIKNVKSVIVPNTDHLKGIPAAAAAGIVAGDPDKELEVIASVEKEAIAEMKEFLKKRPFLWSMWTMALHLRSSLPYIKGKHGPESGSSTSIPTSY